MFKTAIKTGKPVPIPIFPLKPSTQLDLFVLLVTLFVLVITFIYGIKSGYSFGFKGKVVKEKMVNGELVEGKIIKGKMGLAYFLGFIYFAFIGVSTYLAFKLAYY